jgi:uncharacterized repeat protein (TIGR03803 family)
MQLRKSVFSLLQYLALTGIVLCRLQAPAATEKILHLFAKYPNGGGPQDLIKDSKGNFYGTAGGGLYGQGIVYQLTPHPNGGVTQTILYNFTGGADGASPLGVVLVQDKLYGFTGFSNQNGFEKYGVFFELTPTAQGYWKEIVLYNFVGFADTPVSGPSVDQAGNFFGVALGPEACCGADNVFELTRSPAGVWTNGVILSLNGGSDGAYCNGGFTFDRSGNLYGTCRFGGSNEFGNVYELSPSTDGTWTETELYEFTGANGDMNPIGGLIFDTAGNLYGSAYGGGSVFGCSSTGDCGMVYELSPQPSGLWTETILYSFGTNNEEGLSVGPSPVTFDDAGNLFGTTYDDGSGFCTLVEGCGMIFELSPSGTGKWTANILYNFSSKSGDGFSPLGGVVLGPGGRFYGTTSQGGFGVKPGTVFELSQNSSGQWITRIVYDFPTTDGYTSSATLIEDAAGNLYGTTHNGGIYNSGTVFELSPASGGAWNEQILFAFPPGTFPFGELIMDSMGNLYGTTESGTVFELSPATGNAWNEKTIASISGLPHGLVFDAVGNLYGTTTEGGAHNAGSVFRLTPGASGSWTEIVIYSFLNSPTDGAAPRSGVIFDDAGNLYGTTSEGGAFVNCEIREMPPVGCGTVYELSPKHGGGWSETVLYSFKNSSDGAFPYAPVVFDGAGNLYGTTYQGGTNGCPGFSLLGTCGTAFELSPSGEGHWIETVLHSFRSTATDGIFPNGVVLDAAGNLYGTTEEGGKQSIYGRDGFGTVYELTPGSGGDWTEKILYKFLPSPDGGYPRGNLLLDAAGNLYGTTAGFSIFANSVVFQITP